MLVVEFTDKEIDLLQQALKCLLEKLNDTSTLADFKITDISINPYTREVLNEDGSQVHLTAREFDLLYFLYIHRGQVFTKEQIYEKVWGYDNAPDASNLSSFIRKLRLKIEPYPDNPRYIVTVWGVGYKFSGEEKP